MRNLFRTLVVAALLVFALGTSAAVPFTITYNWVYEAGWAATSYLLKKRGGVPALKKYYRHLGPLGSGDAFALAFGWTYEKFKEKFAAKLDACAARAATMPIGVLPAPPAFSRR